MTKTFKNYTPHDIVLNDGRIFNSEGIARVSSSYTDIKDDLCSMVLGDVEGLPNPTDGVYYIVSTIVKNACPNRNDLVVPATAHKDCVRNDKGHIVSVPCFVL